MSIGIGEIILVVTAFGIFLLTLWTIVLLVKNKRLSGKEKILYSVLAIAFPILGYFLYIRKAKEN